MHIIHFLFYINSYFLVYIKYSNNDVKQILRTFLNNSNYLNLA